MSGPDAQGASALALPDQIADWCSGIAGVDITVDDDLFVAGFSSLDLVKLVGILLREHHVRLTALDVLDHSSATALARLVQERATRPGADLGDG